MKYGSRYSRLRRPKGKRTYKPSQKAKKYNYRSVNKVKDVKKIVRRVLKTNEETKFQTWDWSLNPLCLQATTGTLLNNYIVMNPSNATGNTFTIGRGTGSGQMIGDKLRVKSATMDYVITMNPYNATTNAQPMPTYLRAYIYKYKKAPQNDPQVSNLCGTGVSANFFDIGTSDIGFLGNLADLNQRMNRDSYTYYASRTWKIGNLIAASGASPGSPVYSYSNNDFKLSVFGKWNVTKYLPKICTRDDGGVWQDDYVVMLFQLVNYSGGVYTNVTAPIHIEAHLNFAYSDS